MQALYIKRYTLHLWGACLALTQINTHHELLALCLYDLYFIINNNVMPIQLYGISYMHNLQHTRCYKFQG